VSFSLASGPSTWGTGVKAKDRYCEIEMLTCILLLCVPPARATAGLKVWQQQPWHGAASTRLHHTGKARVHSQASDATGRPHVSAITSALPSAGLSRTHRGSLVGNQHHAHCAPCLH